MSAYDLLAELMLLAATRKRPPFRMVVVYPIKGD